VFRVLVRTGVLSQQLIAQLQPQCHELDILMVGIGPAGAQSFFYPKVTLESTYHTFTVADAQVIPHFKPQVYADYT
jgi:hypothetical protein